MSERIPITLLSGYLGSGKTTIVNHLLRAEKNLRLAVLVNDFGAVNIDADLIRNSDATSVELTNGCVCCSIGDDLGAALSAQRERTPPPDAILLEASGVSEPARIARLVGHWPGFTLDAIIVAADGETVRQRAGDKFVSHLVQSQLQCADIIALTKTDLISSQACLRVQAWLRTASSAPVVIAPDGAVPPELAFGANSGQRRDGPQPEDSEHPAFATFTWTPSHPVDIARLQVVLGNLHEDIHRVKGQLVDARTRTPMLVQKVGQRCAITHASDAEQFCLVMISADEQMDFKQVAADLDACAAASR
ncbi:MAG: GTP-binding protein [Rhizobiaceae bacterium]|nr:GTP-binding protein [Rhizobiaceae bacterium]